MHAHEDRTCGREKLALAVAWLTLTACAEGAAVPEGYDETPAATDTDAAESTGDEAGDGPGRDPSGDPVVPLDVATLELEARCYDLDAWPRQRSVSPEGHLWLRISDTRWRVLDPFGRDTVQELPATVTALQAWGAEHAFAAAEATLWDVQGEWPLPLGFPSTLPVPTRLCGDPSRDANGFVVAEGLFYRDRDQWWEWVDPSDEPWSAAAWLADNAGTCLGPDGELWLSRENGEVWRVSGQQATRVAALDGAEAAALVEGVGVAAIHEGTLVVGEPEELWRWHFEAGPVRAVAAGGDAAWVVAGDGVFRMRDGEVLQALVEGEPVAANVLHADAGGGVWALGPRPARYLGEQSGEQVCHLRPSPPIAIEGLHNLARTADDAIAFTVQVHAGTAFSEARLDGEPVAMEPDGIGRWRVAAPLPVSEGWHTLEVLASGSRGATTRRLSFERRRIGDLTWTGDVEPLFVEHCAGAACHGPDLGDMVRPDLSSYEAWLEREETILDRVVTKGDMPPFGVRKDTWGLDAQLTVSEWFETGAVRGEG